MIYYGNRNVPDQVENAFSKVHQKFAANKFSTKSFEQVLFTRCIVYYHIYSISIPLFCFCEVLNSSWTLFPPIPTLGSG